MTGFGRAELSGETVTITVEARSVNHRHLDVGLRLPNAWSSFEGDIRRIVQSRLERGRVDVSVQLAPLPTQSTRTVRVDSTLARGYVEQARQLAREIGVAGDVDIGWVLGRPGVIELTDAPPADPSVVWPLVAAALGRALDELVERRSVEGGALAAELRGLGAALTDLLGQMSARAPIASARREERLRERITTLLASAVDEARIATEVAVWATKTDVTEELARLRVHLDEFALMLDKGGSVGRQLDFLIQEMNREVNTVGSKADDLELSQAALGAKGVLEKIREQVQNLE
ncbi:MAG TPA: YicC/YloC family endoribonuclease [Candidatus Acidoferrum sp.]|nr:YicC/YloC family endoribonuclease [Candidatus Acidoferrum sp.]